MKKLADICGVEKTICFHLVRYSAATLALSNGITIENTAKMLDYKNVRTTQLYAKITDMKLSQDMNSLEEKRGKL